MGSPGFAVVDVETSGLSTRRHRILQVAVVTLDPHGEVDASWSSLVRLRWRFSRVGPRRIHGLRRRHLRGAPPLDEAMLKVRSLVAGRILVGHNVAFDAEFLGRAARKAHTTLDVDGELCTLVLSRLLDPERALAHRLGDVCARYGIALETPHDALADALATAAVLPHLLAGHGVHLDDGDGEATTAALEPLLLSRNGQR